jgi:hypothetical protein
MADLLEFRSPRSPRPLLTGPYDGAACPGGRILAFQTRFGRSWGRWMAAARPSASPSPGADLTSAAHTPAPVATGRPARPSAGEGRRGRASDDDSCPAVLTPELAGGSGKSARSALGEILMTTALEPFAALRMLLKATAAATVLPGRSGRSAGRPGWRQLARRRHRCAGSSSERHAAPLSFSPEGD